MPESQQHNTFNNQSNSLSELVKPEHNAKRLDFVAAQIFNKYSRGQIQRWIDAGHITVNQQTAKKTTTVYTGMVIDLEVQQEVHTNALPENISLNIVAQDNDVIVINKPADLVVHPAAGNWSGTLLNGLLHHFPELENVPRAGIVHRLDKDTTGLMVVARNIIAQNSLVDQLQQRTVNRHYLALVHGHINQKGTVNEPIGRHPVHRTKMSVHEKESVNVKQAITHYEPIEQFGEFTLLKMRLQTGRTHQIRVHLHWLGFPIVGDTTYQHKLHLNRLSAEQLAIIESYGRQALHAFELGFVHPESGENVKYSAELGCESSEDILQLIKGLKNTSN